MAGDWIKFELSTSDKPEVFEIAGQLQIDPDAVVGKLLRVWGWFDQHTVDGHAPSVTKVLLDRTTGVHGFVEAMISCGWLIDDGEAIVVSKFDHHNGETAKKRALAARRKAKQRRMSQQSHDDSHASGVTSEGTGALPREDKREDKETPSSEKQYLDDDYAIAEEMFHTLADKNPGHKKPNLDKWADQIRLMRERDDRKPDEIRALFAWAQADDFWQSNILSPDKLRKRWDQLAIRRNAGKDKTESVQEKAARLNIKARPGESIFDYQARVRTA